MRYSSTVDIVMPIYNPNDWVYQTIDSVLNQTYSNWHFYIVDDCTPQKSKTLDKVKLICNANSKFTFIQLTKNQGPHVALNAGSLEGTGDFLTFVDQDDIWDHRRLERSINLLAKNSDLSFVHSNIQALSSSGQKLDVYNQENKNREKIYSKKIDKKELSKRLVLSNNIRMGTFLVSREAFLKVGKFDAGTGGSELLFLVNIAVNYGIGFVPEKLTFKRRHRLQLSKDKPFMKNISAIKVLKKLSSQYPHLSHVCNIRYKSKLKKIILLELKLRKFYYAKKHSVHFFNILNFRNTFYSLLFLPLFVNLDCYYILSLFRKRF